MKTPESKLGRPLSDETPADGHIHLRVTMERKNIYVRAARGRKLKLSEWMTDACDSAALVTANAKLRDAGGEASEQH